ncbi:PREDICTED: NAC domain-containing protein 62-like [Camelina sativa]|uniref:NAC domain-containing protein 62-like n=1 Tax=Camelina sativa TaxID=90675 RepID=A0ABM0XF44_CAMSA|nr:PREDICTED: NAC domain-containing protein 62-like [Camelina sativa]
MSRLTFFNPVDHELIKYLNAKITKEDDTPADESEIKEVNLCNHEPQEIPGLARMESDHLWHIISPVEKLNGEFQLTKRTSKTGVKSSSSRRTPKIKSDWIMHEYNSLIQHPKKEAFVLCKLMKRVPEKRVIPIKKKHMKRARAPRSSATRENSRRVADPDISLNTVPEASPVLEVAPAMVVTDPAIAPNFPVLEVDDLIYNDNNYWRNFPQEFYLNTVPEASPKLEVAPAMVVTDPATPPNPFLFNT